jgi:hypothetical protein
MTIEDDIAFLGRVPVLQRLGAGALRILAIGAESSTGPAKPPIAPMSSSTAPSR